ncbi:MAG: hypothetical protein K0S95_1472 [Pantoea eucrina]|jgi:hypothetical protein|nr:hypothetical protein [uncultured Pantoea sp.]MDF2784937.1 hypothetical protein [Pantoea eucrina]
MKKPPEEAPGGFIDVCGQNHSKGGKYPAFLVTRYLRNIASINSFQFPSSCSTITTSLIVMAIVRRFFLQVNTFSPLITIGRSR